MISRSKTTRIVFLLKSKDEILPEVAFDRRVVFETSVLRKWKNVNYFNEHVKNLESLEIWNMKMAFKSEGAIQRQKK